jgi:hypothetical protein
MISSYPGNPPESSSGSRRERQLDERSVIGGLFWRRRGGKERKRWASVQADSRGSPLIQPPDQVLPVVPDALWRPLREFHQFHLLSPRSLEFRESRSRDAVTLAGAAAPRPRWQPSEQRETVVAPPPRDGRGRLSSHHFEHGAEQGEGEAACGYPQPCDLDPCRFAAAFFMHLRPPAPSNWVTIVVVGR